MRKDHYAPSGIVPLKAVLFALVATLVVGSIAGPLYGLAIWYNPFIYVSALLSLALGGGMGFVAAAMMRAGHARSTAACVALGVVAAGYAHLVGWVTWTAIAYSDVEEFEWVYLLDPGVFWEAIVAINEVGVWSLRSSSPVNGAMLWAVWGLEGAFVLGAAAFGAAIPGADAVYCEHCRRWCADSDSLMCVADDDASEPLVRRIIDGDLDALAEMNAPAPDHGAWLSVAVAACEGCGRTNAFTLARVTRTFDKEGNEKLATDPLVDRWLVSKEQVQKVREIASRSFEAPEDEEQAVSAAS
jgi:hypothetical protein